MKKKIIILVVVILILIFFATLTFGKISIFSEYGGTTICHGFSFGEEVHDGNINKFPRCLGFFILLLRIK
jgi:hypothetical protein